MGTFLYPGTFYDPNTEFDFSNLGFPEEITLLVNRMVREYRENDKHLFIKTKFQQSTGLQLLKFNSPTNINTVIMVFKKLDASTVDLRDVEVIVKSDQAPTYNNFTKPRKLIVKTHYNLLTSLDECINYIRPFLWIDGNEKYGEPVFDCKYGADSFSPDPDCMVAARILSYEIIDQNTIELKLQGENKAWYYRVDARKVTAFTMITDIAGMLLVISPDGGYKIVGRMLERRLNVI